MKKAIDTWLCKLAFVTLTLVLFTGCATQQFISSEVADKVHKVAVYEEIGTPTSLSTPFRGGVIGMAIQVNSQNSFTRQVSATLDFQEFARQTTKELMETAIKQHAGWTLVPSNAVETADAMFVVDVELMGVGDQPPKFIPSMEDLNNMGRPYRPVVTIRATLIAKPPFEVVRGKDGIKTTDPVAHPVLFSQVGKATNKDTKKCYSSIMLSDNAETFKSAFREAFGIAVQKLADGWTPQPSAK